MCSGTEAYTERASDWRDRGFSSVALVLTSINYNSPGQDSGSASRLVESGEAFNGTTT